MLDGMDEFLDDSIVLPPGDWDQDLLLPVMHERNELRRRKGGEGGRGGKKDGKREGKRGRGMERRRKEGGREGRNEGGRERRREGGRREGGLLLLTGSFL